MKVMLAPAQALCLGCGSALFYFDRPDRATGDVSAACCTFACYRNGVAVRLTAPIVEAPLVYPEWQ